MFVSDLSFQFPAGSPKEAKAFGETFYFTGTACKRGHVAPRYASTAQCSVCMAERAVVERATNPVPRRAAALRYHHRNRDRLIEKMRERRAQNPEQYTEMFDDYRRRHPEKAKEWFARNPGKKAAYWMKYATAKRNACPKWLTPDQHREIEAFYVEAARLTDETGVPHEVDHIIPLNGRGVCGMHVPWNLQVLTEEENRAKGASYERA